MDEHQPRGALGHAPASTFGRYRLLQALAQGARGSVYEAFDPDSRQRVALRVVPLPAARAGRGLLRRWRARRREAAVAQLRHPNIVALLAQGHVGDAAFVATEFVEGIPLTTHLERLPRLPTLQGLALAVQLLAVLSFAHARRQVHGAIQPDNLLVTHKGQLKVAGFGWAAGDPGARVPGRFHVPCYLAPEQGRGAPADARADLYSAALVARLLLGGGPPNQPATDLSPKLAAVFARALAVQPQARYPDAAALCAALQEAVGEPVWDRPAVSVPPTSEASRLPQAPERLTPEARPGPANGESAAWTAAEVAAFQRFITDPPTTGDRAPADTGPSASGRAAPTREAATPAQRQPTQSAGGLVQERDIVAPTTQQARAHAHGGRLAAAHAAPAARPSSSRRRRGPAVAALAAVLALGVAWTLFEPAAKPTVTESAAPGGVAAPVEVAEAPVQAPVPQPVPPLARSEPPALQQQPAPLGPTPDPSAIATQPPAPAEAQRQDKPRDAAVQAAQGGGIDAAQRTLGGPAAPPDAGRAQGQQRDPVPLQAPQAQARRAVPPQEGTRKATASPKPDGQRTAQAARAQPARTGPAPAPAAPPRPAQSTRLAIAIDPHLGCRQQFTVAREACKAIRCSSAEYARNPVCLRQLAEQRERDLQREQHGGGS